jgi:hypothetical protein
MRRTLSLAAAAVVGITGTASAQGPLLLETEFSVFTSENAQGYTKPLFTSFQEGFASNLYHSAVYDPSWGIGVDLSTMGMFIPESHRSYDAALPECYSDQTRVRTAEISDGRQVTGVHGSVVRPTVFGDVASNPVFAVPQTEADENCGTVGFAEGNDIAVMPGIPNIQVLLRAPSRTELRARFYPYSDGDRSLTYVGVAVSQQLDQFVGLFKDSLMGLSVSASWHSLTWTDIMDATGYTAGVHFSKSWSGGFGVYAGAQIEGMSGRFEAQREKSNGENVSSPYDEVRNGSPVAFDIESFNAFRALAGVSFRSGVVDLHVDGALAAQPVVSAGLAINIASF